MAWRQRHAIDLTGIPSAHDQAAAVRRPPDGLDESFNLVDMAAVRTSPVSPLCAIDPSKVAVFIRPFIPYRYFVFAKVSDIGIAFQEPEQLVDDRAQVKFLCRQQGKG